MSYTIENVNGCTRKIIFNIEKLDLSSEISMALNQKRKEASLRGFRKGKAPVEMVKDIYGHQIESDAVNRFVQNQLYTAISEADLRVVGYPAFENMEYKAGQSIKFEAIIEIFPEVKVKDLSKLSFSKDKVEVTATDIDNVKKNYLNSKSEMKELTDSTVKLAKGHYAVMNFQGVKEDGERPENMKGEEFVLEIGSGQFIPGFEEGMIGMKKGEKRDVNVTFPATYQAPELQNAKVKFEVELLEIKERKLPELTEELAKEFGFESVADFDKKNLENLSSQKERQVKEKLHQDILEKLISENPFEVPGTLLEQQSKHLKEEMTNTLTHQGFNKEMIEQYFSRWHDDLQKKAEFQVKSGLILDNLSKEYKIEASESDLEAKIEETAKTANIDAEQVRKYYTSNQKMKSNMMYAIREEKTFEAIIAKVKVS